MSDAPAILDLSQLPHSDSDKHSPVWWGNTLLLLVETVMFGLLLAGYFYLRQNFDRWPPPRIHRAPPLFDSAPSLGLPVVNLILIIVSFIPMYWTDRVAQLRDRARATAGLMVTVGFCLTCLIIRFFEFRSLRFRIDDNAYASIVWTILGMHTLHLIAGTSENALVLAWTLVKPLDDKHARDVHLSAVYWYWIIVVWLVLFSVIFLSPRWG
jgi:cytochrome c oxidase subunit III